MWILHADLLDADFWVQIFFADFVMACAVFGCGFSAEFCGLFPAEKALKNPSKKSHRKILKI